MYIKPFAVEQWMNEWEVGAKYNIAETCVDSISMDELFDLTGEDKDAFLEEFTSRRLTYGDIEGQPLLKEGVTKLYRTVSPDEVITTHGAAGANHHVFYSLINPGDRVVTINPTYQQLYSIPESLGADVQILQLKKEDGYLPNLEELSELVTADTKMICLNNPNNPTGGLMGKELLEKIIKIAREVNAYILCDEVYRHLIQEGDWQDSIVDLYEKGISVGSMSKVFSLAGLRLGWVVTHDEEAVKTMLGHRDYTLISCGQFDESLAGLALKHADVLIERARSIVRENLTVLDEWVKNEPHVSYVKPKAGSTALVYYDLDIPSYEFCIEMYKKTGAFVTPGDCFGQEYSMRIGYAYGRQDLIDGLKAVSEFIAMKVGGTNNV